MAELFQVTPQNITVHLKAIYADGELDEAATCKEYLQVRAQLKALDESAPEWNTYFGDNKLIGKSEYYIKNDIKLRKQDVKSRIKNALGNKCMLCGKEGEITIHHKELCRYHQKDAQTNSYISNIVLLCNECHINVHKCITANKRTNEYLKPYSNLPIYEEIFHKNVFETSNLSLLKSTKREGD